MTTPSDIDSIQNHSRNNGVEVGAARGPAAPPLKTALKAATILNTRNWTSELQPFSGLVTGNISQRPTTLMKNMGPAKHTCHHQKQMNPNKMAALDIRQPYSWKSKWDDGIGQETEGSQRRTTSSRWDGVIRCMQVQPLLLLFHLTTCLMPTLLPLISIQCTTHVWSSHVLTYRIHKAVRLSFDRVSWKLGNLQFCLVWNMWGWPICYRAYRQHIESSQNILECIFVIYVA